MKAVIYARVSTDEDRQDVNNQIQPLHDLAKSLNLNVVKEYVDHVSGGDSNRPAFKTMMDAAYQSNFNVILIWSLDRFSREGILNTMSYLERLKSRGIAIKSLRESWLDTRDESMGQLLIAIFSWFAQHEREQISKRIKAGLKGKKNVGKRGKDKKPRRKSGYWRRWQKESKKTPPLKNDIDYLKELRSKKSDVFLPGQKE